MTDTNTTPDIEQLAELINSISIACQMPRHDTGQNGMCDPGQDASWIVEIIHHGTGNPKVFICEHAIIWIRGRWNQNYRCTACGGMTTLADAIRIVGPIQGATS